MGRRLEPVPGKQQAEDQDDIEQDRGGGGGGEAVGRIEHPAHHCDDRHAQQVRQGQPGQQDRGIEQFRPAGAEARRNDQEHLRHEDFDDDGKHRQHQHQHGKDLIGEQHRLAPAPLLEPFGKQRHEGCGESPFGRQTPEHVGKTEGDDERLDHADRAQIVRQKDIARETEDAAGQGPDGYDGGGSKQLHCLPACDVSGE